MLGDDELDEYAGFLLTNEAKGHQPALNCSLSLRLVVIAAKTMCIGEYNALSLAKSRGYAITRAIVR